MLSVIIITGVLFNNEAFDLSFIIGGSLIFLGNFINQKKTVHLQHTQILFMKAVSVKEIKTELSHRSPDELLQLCLKLSKFKKENKELLTYLLFESENEENFINSVKIEIDEQFKLINTKTYYFIKKSIRKILRIIKKYIRYSKLPETEVTLLLYFCSKLKTLKPSIQKNTVLLNIYKRELANVKKKTLLLHEDLQHDYGLELEKLASSL